MKKLMIAAAAAAVTGGAFAAPLVYDYKASTKQMNLKEMTITFNKEKVNVYAKYMTTGALKGYLIVDQDGATSSAIQDLAGTGNSNPATCPWDYGRNRAFLVVINTKADKVVRAPKIIPSVLDAKWIVTKVGATSGIAEGYLYSGGEFKAGQVREAFDLYDGVHSVTRTANAAAGFIQDYCWTSIYLFGQYNGPLFMTAVWDNAEKDIDGAQDADLQQLFEPEDSYFYHDTWMNGAGFGKWVSNSPKVKKPCCGMPVAKVTTKVLDSLAGNLKGGLFLCTENFTNLDFGYVTIGDIDWEDQFFCCRDSQNDTHFGKWAVAGDFDQTDLWQDGGIELNTRDCVSGTWAIKLNGSLVEVALTAKEKDELVFPGPDEDADGLDTLWANIKGAAVKLDKNVMITNGKEIWDTATAYHDQVPFVTPQFCKYYGLANYK